MNNFNKLGIGAVLTSLFAMTGCKERQTPVEPQKPLRAVAHMQLTVGKFVDGSEDLTVQSDDGEYSLGYPEGDDSRFRVVLSDSYNARDLTEVKGPYLGRSFDFALAETNEIVGAEELPAVPLSRNPANAARAREAGCMLSDYTAAHPDSTIPDEKAKAQNFLRNNCQ